MQIIHSFHLFSVTNISRQWGFIMQKAGELEKATKEENLFQKRRTYVGTLPFTTHSTARQQRHVICALFVCSCDTSPSNRHKNGYCFYTYLRIYTYLHKQTNKQTRFRVTLICFPDKPRKESRRKSCSFWFVFGSYPDRISARTWTILTDVSRESPQSFWKNYVTVGRR